jgi:hypothetical protein
MPIDYHRHDQRRLTTVTVTVPCSIDDILGVIDRQASEHTWDHALLDDLRAAVINASADTDLVLRRGASLGSGAFEQERS